MGGGSVAGARHGVEGLTAPRSVKLLLFGQHPDNMQKSLQAGLRSLPRSERATVKPFPGGEVPFAPYAEESTTTEGHRSFFSGPVLGVHGISCTARLSFLFLGRRVIVCRSV